MVVYVLWANDVAPEDFKIFADPNMARANYYAGNQELLKVCEENFDFFVETENNFYQVYDSTDRTFRFFKHKKEAYDFAITLAAHLYKISESYADDSFTQMGFCGGIFVDPTSFYDRGKTFGVDTNGCRLLDDEYYND